MTIAEISHIYQFNVTFFPHLKLVDQKKDIKNLQVFICAMI